MRYWLSTCQTWPTHLSVRLTTSPCDAEKSAHLASMLLRYRLAGMSALSCLSSRYILLHPERWCQLFSFAIILWSYFLDPEFLPWTLACNATTVLFLLSFFFPPLSGALKPILTIGQEFEGKFGGKDGHFLSRVYLEALVKTIIYVPRAIFPGWPIIECSVVDMPVVLEKKGGMAGMWVLFSV